MESKDAMLTLMATAEEEEVGDEGGGEYIYV